MQVPVYNLACDMGGMGFIENNKALCMISVLINTHLLLAARDAGVERFFYASSTCVYNAEKQLSPEVVPLKESKKRNFLKMVFLSRISTKKNLDGALKSLSFVKSNVQYIIFGTNEDKSYWQACKEIIASLPSNIEVVYKGQLAPEEVISEMSQHDVLFLPAHHENFGHVIHEALRAGIPVLISDKTPWHQIQVEGCGWEYDDRDCQGFARKIDDLAGMDSRAFLELKMKALDYGRRFSKENDIVQKNRRMFEKAKDF